MTIEQTMSMSNTKSEDTGRFLRNALRANVIFSALSGLLLLFGTSSVAAFLGLEAANANTILTVMGVGLLLWAGYTFWVSSQSPVNKWAVFSVIEGDVLWVIGSIILLFTGWVTFSTSGNWAVAIVADIVGLFAILQYWGWRRIQNQS